MEATRLHAVIFLLFSCDTKWTSLAMVIEKGVSDKRII